MMNYEEFKKTLKENIRDYLPPELKDIDIEFGKVAKVNIEKDSIHFLVKGDYHKTGPTLYINDLYQRYSYTGDFDTTVRAAMQIANRAVTENPFRNPRELQGPNEDNTICVLINTKQNAELLETVPHREIHDLSLIYRWRIQMSNHELATGLITNDIAQKGGWNEEQLYDMAMANMKTLLPTKVMTMKDTLEELLEMEGCIDDFIREPPIYVLTNPDKHYGATAMLDKDALHSVAEKLQSDLYIIPSSVHEVLAIRTDEMPLEEMAQMVYEINLSQVELEERLSNQVYHYDRQTQELTQATDEPPELDNEPEMDEGMAMGGM